MRVVLGWLFSYRTAFCLPCKPPCVDHHQDPIFALIF